MHKQDRESKWWVKNQDISVGNTSANHIVLATVHFRTPLHRALFFLYKHGSRVPFLLLRAGASLYSPRDKDGLTPLDLLSKQLWFERCQGSIAFALPDVSCPPNLRPGSRHILGEIKSYNRIGRGEVCAKEDAWTKRCHQPQIWAFVFLW